MRQLPPYGSGGRRKAIVGAVLVVLAPVVLTVLVQSVNEAARLLIELLGPVIPIAIGIVVLVVLYRLLFGQRYR